MDISRREILAAAPAILLGSALQAAKPPGVYSFWVFGLLKPKLLKIQPADNSRLHCFMPDANRILEGPQTLEIAVSNAPLHIAGPEGEPIAAVLEIPGAIQRRYFGTFDISVSGGLLIPVVSMHREIAVASIVGAELPTNSAPFDALAAQAVVARSFLAGTERARHSVADFCDTTHCQFLRAPALPRTAAAEAVRETNSVALHFGSRAIPAQYSAACGGHTDRMETGGYSYRSVVCEICQRKRLSRRGNGLGLCQEGAIGLARAGWPWREILRKYYPEASLRRIG